jgi:Xaa-Pro aminopeptidase
MSEMDIDLTFLVGGRASSAMFYRLADTPSGSALIIPREGNPALFSYPVDYVSTREESWLPVVELEGREGANETIANYINEYLEGGGRVGIDPNSMSYGSYTFFHKNLDGELTDVSQSILPEVLFGLYPEEIKFQREVSKLADIAVAEAREMIAPGVKEYDVAAEANYAMMRRGAQMQSFPTIVSGGERSAYSHGWPGRRELMAGDLIIVDLGPMIHGYAADETRTFLLGQDKKKEKMLRAVDAAVAAVIESIRAGVSCRELDAISRKVLKQHDFPDYPHTLGHPLSGFRVPRLAKNSEDTLKEGMLFTVEPGIYLPGYGGVRLEENVVVTEDGFEQLTKNPRIYNT